MRKLLFLIILASLTSCLTVKQIERNCDQFAQICLETTQTDTIIIHDSTFVTKRDTIVEFELVKETVFDTVIIPSKGLSLNSDTSTLFTGLASSTAFISDSKLFHYLESGDTVLNIRLNDALTEIVRLERIIKSKEKTNTVTVREDTKFGNFCKKYFFVTLFIFIFALLFWIRKVLL